MSKAEVRAMARELDLPIWDKPAAAFAWPRDPYGSRVTDEKLGQSSAPSGAARTWHSQLRVRHMTKLPAWRWRPDAIATSCSAAARLPSA